MYMILDQISKDLSRDREARRKLKRLRNKFTPESTTASLNRKQAKTIGLLAIAGVKVAKTDVTKAYLESIVEVIDMKGITV